MVSFQRYVVDGSVALKWFLREQEDSVAQALALLTNPPDHPLLSTPFVQPIHFVAEVAAVLARLKPEEAEDDLNDLLALDFEVADSPAIVTKAIGLSKRYQHHLFDTLYHAVALCTPNTVLVTADRRYFDKACNEGNIVLLDELRVQ